MCFQVLEKKKNFKWAHGAQWRFILFSNSTYIENLMCQPLATENLIITKLFAGQVKTSPRWLARSATRQLLPHCVQTFQLRILISLR